MNSWGNLQLHKQQPEIPVLHYLFDHSTSTSTKTYISEEPFNLKFLFSLSLESLQSVKTSSNVLAQFWETGKEIDYSILFPYYQGSLGRDRLSQTYIGREMAIITLEQGKWQHYYLTKIDCLLTLQVILFHFFCFFSISKSPAE